MAHCDEYLEHISAAVDGALSPEEWEKLNAHLSTCVACQKLYDDLAALHAAMADLPPVEVPAGLKDRVMDAVAAEAENAKVLPFTPKKTSRHWQRWLASAAVLAVVVMGTWSWKPWESHADAPRSNEVATARGMDASAAGAADSGLTPVTGSRRTPTAIVLEPSNSSAPADASVETAPAAMPKLASAPLDASAPMAGFTAESADAPAEKKAAPAENGAAPSDDEMVYGYASVGQAPEVSVTEDVPAVQSIPTESGDTIAPQSAVMPRLFSVPLPQSVPSPAEEGVLEQNVTSQEQAVNVLANYIYEFVGEVELVEDGLNMNYAVNSPTGVSGVVTCVGENQEVYFLNYKDDLSPDPLLYSVNKQTSEVTLLEQEELSDLPF